ncbi:MAG: hypothetical protein R3C45_18740 [Phycisphaerales bacterium]
MGGVAAVDLFADQAQQVVLPPPLEPVMKTIRPGDRFSSVSG